MKRMFYNSRSAYQLYRNRAPLNSMVRDTFKGIYNPSLRTIMIIIGALIYIISPIDFIPDFIPVIGWVDDGTILYLVVKQLKRETDRYILNKNGQNS